MWWAERAPVYKATLTLFIVLGEPIRVQVGGHYSLSGFSLIMLLCNIILPLCALVYRLCTVHVSVCVKGNIVIICKTVSNKMTY